jgi:hypothetical protein
MILAMSAGSPSNPLLSAPQTTPGKAQHQSSTAKTIAGWLLQASHRIGAIALLAALGTAAQMYRVKDFHLPLAIAAGCADVGLCLALLAKMLVRRDRILQREANGVAIFNLVLFSLAIIFMIFARLTLIRAAAADFFTPTPAPDVQPRHMA